MTLARTVDPSGATSEDRALYRRASGELAKGVAIISAVHGGRDHASTIIDYLSVSYDPPTMVASLYGLSRIADAVEEAGGWALSVLAADQRWIADRLGSQGAPLIALLDQIPHHRREEGAPALIDGALAHFELRSVAMHAAATHTLVVGEVTWMEMPSAGPGRPLIRYRSGYGGMS
ncbi:MAG: flavin reductase [Microbacteriaceae bacterium]|jgi:flavin reductase (DIM6/NTAB) family NADH-FMN oxidoreductase RutF|nr:flavin reductase [Microbacteriaceae bacterium]